MQERRSSFVAFFFGRLGLARLGTLCGVGNPIQDLLSSVSRGVDTHLGC